MIFEFLAYVDNSHKTPYFGLTQGCRGIVVKQSKRRGGRPAADPADLRSARVALRLHPDLVQELDVACREIGVNRSMYVEKIMVNFLNAHAAMRQRPVLDAIGRILTAEALERLHQAQNPKNFEAIRAALAEPASGYILPPVSAASMEISGYGYKRRKSSPPRPLKKTK